MASSDPLVVRVLKLLERASAAFASEVIAIHDPAKNILEERVHPRRPITVIMNGVDETELPIVNRHNDGKFRIVYNGTINYNLNLSIVIRALERLRSTRDDVYQKGEFHLYGDGPDLKNILDLASRLQLRNVLYHGQYQFDLMMRELASASACILPPKKDVYSDLYYSLKLTEMIYLKIPVIATRLKTYLTYYPEDCITYFESQDLDGLVESICYVHDHPLQAEKRSQRAFAEYQKYAWPVMEKRYIDLLDRLSNKWQG
jgi:glycosyltransferase involved in cell wall biosynthesis